MTINDLAQLRFYASARAKVLLDSHDPEISYLPAFPIKLFRDGEKLGWDQGLEPERERIIWQRVIAYLDVGWTNPIEDLREDAQGTPDQPLVERLIAKVTRDLSTLES